MVLVRALRFATRLFPLVVFLPVRSPKMKWPLARADRDFARAWGGGLVLAAGEKTVPRHSNDH
jgi:hypothetical protein